jgi:hypothetical protein
MSENEQRARAVLDDIIPGRIVDFDEWRTKAIAAAMDEAELRERKVVAAWLRSQPGPVLRMAADCIERAEHRKEPADGNA